MKQYWLVKSEPDEFSWNDLVSENKTIWSGVRNYQARNNLRLMKKGDPVFFYHSLIGKQIVGVASVSKEYFHDPSTDNEAWVAVELVPEFPLENPVSLDWIKSSGMFEDLLLVRNGRLSVMPVSKDHFEKIMNHSKQKD